MSRNEGPIVKPEQEYSSLREELNQSKKFVFERPLIMVGVGLTLMATEVEQYHTVLSAILAGLLIFNLWFTVNRLMSAARIVAYIQIVLESGSHWLGWETSLRKYRTWLSQEKRAKEIVDKELAESHEAIPDALMYYPPIFQLHVVLAVLSLIAGIAGVVQAPNQVNMLAYVILVTLTGVFAHYCSRWLPDHMRTMIERNIIIWKHALGLRNQDDKT